MEVFTHLYVHLAEQIPWVGQAIYASRLTMQNIPGINVAYGVIAIAFAPLAEEYLFRGLVYRSLDRQWGERRAVLGAATFFAIYHPPLAWLPVALVGATNCILFKRARRLAPAVLLHMAYNTVVVLWT